MDEERQPRPIPQELPASVGVNATIGRKLKLGLDELSLAVLAVVVSIGLSVGFGVPGPWWGKLGAGLGSFLAACAALKWWRNGPVRFARWLTGL